MKRWGFWEVISHKDGTLVNRISALIRDTRELGSFHCLPPQHSKKMAIYKPGREHSPEADHPCTPISDLLGSKTVRNKFLLFKPPGLWYLVTSGQTA